MFNYVTLSRSKSWMDEGERYRDLYCRAVDIEEGVPPLLEVPELFNEQRIICWEVPIIVYFGIR